LPGPAVATAPGTTGAPTATKDKKRSLAVPVVIALVAGALVGGGSAAGVSALIGHNGPSQQQTSGNPQTITINDSGDVNAVTAIAKKAAPSVVTINVSASQEAGTGSGVILSDNDGTAYVLTNTHVVTLDGESGKGSVEVTTYDGKLYKATVVGTDPIVDLAVIKFSATGLTPIEWGDSSKLNVGDRVVAIGAPLGLSNTVTDGIVSALNRSIQIASSAAPDSNSDGNDQSTPKGDGNSPFNFWNGDGNGNGKSPSPSQSSDISLPVIQTDAAINPGNSGGALVDDSGKLVGINVAIASTGSSDASSQTGSIGVGFAIPASLAQRIAGEIEKTGKGTHGLLGASVTDATADNSSTVGALIESVTGGGAAASAGLQKGDVVTEFNGLPITSSSDLTAQVRALAPGSKVTLDYTRGGKSTSVSVTLGTLSS
jgi:putative serine protease PepD